MNQRIPAGVVTTTDGLTSELQRSAAVNPDDIAQLWKVYTTQSSKIQDAEACRLENLFWRLWADPRLQKGKSKGKVLSGGTLATLFMAIHDSGSIHTTPRASKTTNTNLSKPNDTSKVTILTIANNQHDGPGSRKSSSKSPLPPILKNANTTDTSTKSQPSSYKVARVVLPDPPSHQRPAKNAGTANNNNQATTTTTPTTTSSTTSLGIGGKPGRKRPSFVVNTSASSRRRGVIIRRKSPITTPTVEMDEPVIKQIAEEEKDAEAEEPKTEDHSKNAEDAELELPWRSLSYLKKPSNDDDITSMQPSQAAASPSPSSPPPANFSVSSVARHRSPVDVEHPHTATTTTAAADHSQSGRALVDRDFRTHFVERKRHGSGGAASSLTSSLSSSHFKDLLSTSNNSNTTTNASAISVSGSLSPEKRGIALSPNNNTSATAAATAGAGAAGGSSKRNSVPAPKPIVSTSQTQTQAETTSGVFSVSRKSQDIGEQLTSLMRSR